MQQRTTNTPVRRHAAGALHHHARPVSRTLLAALTALVPLCQAAAGEGHAPNVQPIVVGCMFPMAGPGGLYGQDSAAAIELALEQTNGAGDGRPIRVLIEDTHSKPAIGVRIAERYITEVGVDFLCGAVSSGVGLAVSEVSRKHGVIFIGTDHASSRLTLEKLHPHYFRVSNNTYQSMAAGALYLAELQSRTGWRSIAFIGPDYEYGRVMWRDLRAKLDEAGVIYEVAGTLWPRLYEPDLTPYITEILRLGPDILVDGHWGGDVVTFIRQAMPFGLFEKVRFFNFDAGGNYEVMATLGEEMPLGLVLSARHHNNWPDTPANREFVRRFHDRTGRYPSYAAEGAYAGILAIAAAVRAVGGDTSDTGALIDALEGMRLPLPEDPPGFVSYMDPATHQMVQMQAIGEVVPDPGFPPATTMLGRFRVYEAERLLPPPGALAGQALTNLD